MTEKQTLCWHIVPVDENGVAHLTRDLAHVEVKSGLTVSMSREDVVGIDAEGQCGAGLYMSRNPVHALKYAPYGKIAICRVSSPASAVVQEVEDDKLVTTERTVVAMLGVKETRRVLVGWSIWCARQALALISNPDQRSIDALNVVERWLKGEATQEELTAARAAAYAAYADAADAATYAATYAAAYTARAAARAAAYVYATADVYAAQSHQLEKMLLEAMGLS